MFSLLVIYNLPDNSPHRVLFCVFFFFVKFYVQLRIHHSKISLGEVLTTFKIDFHSYREALMSPSP